MPLAFGMCTLVVSQVTARRFGSYDWFSHCRKWFQLELSKPNRLKAHLNWTFRYLLVSVENFPSLDIRTYCFGSAHNGDLAKPSHSNPFELTRRCVYSSALLGVSVAEVLHPYRFWCSDPWNAQQNHKCTSRSAVEYQRVTTYILCQVEHQENSQRRPYADSQTLLEHFETTFLGTAYSTVQFFKHAFEFLILQHR